MTFSTVCFLGTTKSPQIQDVACLIRVLKWPKDYVFPCIDVARLAILNPPACQMILSKHSEEFVDILLQNLALSEKVNSQMLALRSLANLFDNEKGKQRTSFRNWWFITLTILSLFFPGLELMIKLQSTVIPQLSALFPVESKPTQIAMATVLLNYTIVFTSVKSNVEAQVTCLNLCLLFLQGMTDSEARFRNLVSLGTLLSAEQRNRKEAKNLEAKEKIEAAKLLDTTDKVLKCADAVLNALW